MGDTMSEIKPALTREEWARVQQGAYMGHSLSEGQLGVPRGSEWMNHEAMALANYNLPDTDPRKITRADVETLRIAERHCDDFPDLLTLATKLAALLPPEGVDVERLVREDIARHTRNLFDR